MIPKYQVEVWHGANKIYTLTDIVAHIHTKQSLTNAVGTFSFTLPTKKNGSTYYYTDIALYDKVKIWLGYEGDSFAGDPLFVGRISQISTPLNMSQGYLRMFNGKDQGEVLLRRLKGIKSWSAVAPHTIATEIATDLGLGTGQIDTDTGAMPISIEIDPDRYEVYFNLLRTISDHWYAGSNQVKKDFFVDVNNNLVWKSRPFRISGVETLTVGENIESYTVLRDLESVRNKIYVYGMPLKGYPLDKDSWTESLSPSDGVWTLCGGTLLTLDGSNKVVGSYSIKVTSDVDNDLCVSLTFYSGKEANANLYPSLNFKINVTGQFTDGTITLVDSLVSGNEVFQVLNISKTGWNSISLPVGKKSADQWIFAGGATSFNWTNIKRITIDLNFSGAPTTRSFWIDNLFFNSRNYYGFAEDATSQTTYEIREEAIIDEELPDDTECERRAQTLLYQLKDPLIRVDLVTKGNTNIKMGDQIPLTIPAENISAIAFDVLTVEHDVTSQIGFKTAATMLNTSNMRTLPPRTKDELLVRKLDVIQSAGEAKQWWNKPWHRGG